MTKQSTAVKQRVRRNRNLQHAINTGYTVARRKGYTTIWDVNQCIIQEIERVCRVANRDEKDASERANLEKDGYSTSL
jgi:hypothetical protein